jgi:predicted nucleotidyltransferase
VDPVDAIEHALCEEPSVQFALLFGSRAGKRARPDSDWDLAVYLDPRLSERERFDLRRRLGATLAPALDVDPVVLNDAPPLLAKRALGGRPLLMRDRSAFVRFFVHALGQAEDQSYFDALHARARRERLERGAFGRP